MYIFKIQLEALSTKRVTSNGSPSAMGPLTCLSCLSVCNVDVLWPNGWVDQDATWYGVEVGLSPVDIALDGDPATERGTVAPTFRTTCIVTKRSPISATAEILFFCGRLI